jgi:hypothetical protein
LFEEMGEGVLGVGAGCGMAKTEVRRERIEMRWSTILAWVGRSERA